MFLHYLRMAQRQWRTSPTYTLINIIGLTAGLTVSLLIGGWLRDELTFDHYFSHHTTLARIVDTRSNTTTDLMPPPLAAELKTKYGRFFHHIALVFPNFPHVLGAGEKKITAEGEWAQPEWPDMLDLHML